MNSAGKQRKAAALGAVASAALIVVSLCYLIAPAAAPAPESLASGHNSAIVATDNAASTVLDSHEPDAPASESEAAPVADEATAPEEGVATAPSGTATSTDGSSGDPKRRTETEAAPAASIPSSSPSPVREPEAEAQAPASVPPVSVSVRVTSSAVGSPVSGSASPTFEPGATPLDALLACGLSVDASSGQFGTYVSAIGGLAEKEHGGASGWIYRVNGTSPMKACDRYELADGDRVEWVYVTG